MAPQLSCTTAVIRKSHLKGAIFAHASRSDAWGMALYLPYDELVSELGEPCAKALLGAFGGGRLYVPAAPDADHPITQAIGAKNAAKLADMVSTGIGGLWVELPLGEASAAKALRRRVLELAADTSLTERQIVATLGVSPVTVRRARKKLRAEAARAA